MKSTNVNVNSDASRLLASIHHLAPDHMFMEARIISTSGFARQQYFDIATLRASQFDLSALRSLDGQANVYFSVIARIRHQGTADACGPATVIWCDFDGGAPAALPLPPSVVVETSPKRYQAYWLLNAPTEDLDEVEVVNRAVASLHGGDSNSCDRARVLRLPGFRNMKYPDRPYARLVACRPEICFALDELAAAFPSRDNEPALTMPRRYANTDAPSWLSLVYDAILDHVAARGSAIQPSGGGAKVRCPLHDDEHPSLSIHPVRGWICFAGCGQGRLTSLAVKLGISIE